MIGKRMEGRSYTKADKGAIKGANTARRKNVDHLDRLQAGRGLQPEKNADFGQDGQSFDVTILTKSTRRHPRKNHGGKVPLRNGLTTRRAGPHTFHAAPDASGAGRRNPFDLRRIKRQSRALFLCPALLYGCWCGAGFGLAGSVGPVFDPRTSGHHFRRRNRRGGSIQSLRSHQMNTPQPATGEIRPNSAPLNPAVPVLLESLRKDLQALEAEIQRLEAGDSPLAALALPVIDKARLVIAKAERQGPEPTGEGRAEEGRP